jgi:chromobox protein 5
MSPQKPRKSAARDDSSDIGSTSIKKRGRKSVSKVESEDGMDVDEVAETRAPKKAKKNVVNAKKHKTDSSDADERVVQTMDRYMDKLDWEGLVKNVDTVERVGDALMVFFTLYVPRYFPGSMFL